MALVGRPPPAYGLKFFVKAGSPDPVITRHWCPAFGPARAAGAAPVATSTAVAASAAATGMAASRRELRKLRRIGCPFSPGRGDIAGTDVESVNGSGTCLPRQSPEIKAD